MLNLNMACDLFLCLVSCWLALVWAWCCDWLCEALDFVIGLVFCLGLLSSVSPISWVVGFLFIVVHVCSYINMYVCVLVCLFAWLFICFLRVEAGLEAVIYDRPGRRSGWRL
jgi:hypothetical protein